MKCIFEVNTICRLCLRVTENVYRLNNTHHKALIESIIKLKQFQYVPTDDEYVCYICNALLKKTFNFMQTVWNAQDVICVILKNTNKITKPMLECIDRHNNGLNPVNLSSVVICDNVKFESSDDSTDIEELDLDLLIDKIDGQTKTELKDKNKHNINKIENHSTNDKTQIISISSSSDESKEPDKCNLDEMEVEIDDIKTEIDDPLTKDFNTDGHDDPNPKPKKSKGITERIALWKAKSGALQRKKQEKIDSDYQPSSTSHSEDSNYDSYDDLGKPIKRPKDDIVYPRKCDHCDYEVPKRLEHYRHYQFSHPNKEYPYKTEKNEVCSICGKLFSHARIRFHEASHVTQKLKCTICGNVYSNKLRLSSHKHKVHPRTKFTCDYCSKTFKTRTCITRHIRTHTGSKPFKCHICGDGFAHSGNRSIHIRSKHQNYKYVPKKHKRDKKVRRNKKHNSTDTENSSSNEKIISIRRRKRRT